MNIFQKAYKVGGGQRKPFTGFLTAEEHKVNKSQIGHSSIRWAIFRRKANVMSIAESVLRNLWTFLNMRKSRVGGNCWPPARYDQVEWERKVELHFDLGNGVDHIKTVGWTLRHVSRWFCNGTEDCHSRAIVFDFISSSLKPVRTDRNDDDLTHTSNGPAFKGNKRPLRVFSYDLLILLEAFLFLTSGLSCEWNAYRLFFCFFCDDDVEKGW